MRRSRNQDLLDHLMESFSLRGVLLHQATLFVGASLLLIVSVSLLWQSHRNTMVAQGNFELTPEKVIVNPPPPWAEVDPRQLVLAQAEESSSSILDPALVPKTASAFRTVGFVERVNTIEKSRAGLKIDLDYRLPVALVELREKTVGQGWPKELKQILVPVDRNGVVMPQHLADDLELPLLTMKHDSVIQLSTWADWPDSRVQEAAAISQYFAQEFAELGMARVATFATPDSQTAEYEIWSSQWQRGTTILWGNAIGKEGPGEASPDQKLEAIRVYVQTYGKMNLPSGRRIDVRGGQPVVAPRNLTAARIQETF